MLSAKELMEVRASKLHPRSLPSMPPKEFVPTHSEEETAAIDAMVREKMSFLKEERAERRNLLSSAEWIPDECLARLTKRVGCWETYGIERKGVMYLQPEEALFLIEVSRLELSFGGMPVSVQQAYHLLLKENLCSLAKYRVYAHLNRQGYRVLRTKMPPTPGDPDANQPPSPKRPRLETGAACSSEPCATDPVFQLPAGCPSDLNSIANFATGADNIRIDFSDVQLLPEAARNRRATYTVERKRFVAEQPSEALLCASKPATSVRTWAEYKAAVPPTADGPDSALYRGKTKPLLNGRFEADVYARLKKFSIAEPSDLVAFGDGQLPVVFDVYSPGKKFRKTNPGPPCYAVAVVTWNSPFPSPGSLAKLKRRCADGIVPLIAITGQGSDIAFYQLKGSVSPFSV